VTVWGEDDLSRQVEVRQDGKIALPLIGEVQAEGLNVTQLRGQIEEGLKEYIRHPRVEVAVLAYANLSVYVLGQVNQPGSYDVPRGSGVMEVIALAGGLLPTADKEANLLRADRTLIPVNLEGIVEATRAGSAPTLEPGDVLIIPFRRQPEQIAVMGQVAKPGMYPFTPGMRLLDGLGLAGMAEASSDQPSRPDMGNVVLTRDGVSRTLNVGLMLRSGDLTENLALCAGDIITVPEAARKRVYTFGSFRSPGVHYLDAGEGLLEVVLASGGPVDGAKLDKATLVRMVGGQPKTIEVKLDRLIAHGDTSQNIPLENGDILFLPGPKKGGLRLDSIMPFVPYLLF
jgi:polysaccharide export outer membrane protein